MVANTKTPNDRKQHVQCKHCGKLRTGNRPRGLCWTCYYTPSVRDAYPPDSSRLPVENRCAGDPEETHPYPPGSPEKIAYLAGLVLHKRSMFHPNDRPDHRLK